MPIKKKKKEELDASLMGWYLPGSLSPVTVRIPALGNRIYSSLKFSVDYWRQRQIFNLGAYLIYGSVLPTPLEQMAFAADPLGIVPPYEWRGPFHAVLDASALFYDPIGVVSSQFSGFLQTAYGDPDYGYWQSEEGMAMGDLFASSPAAVQ